MFLFSLRYFLILSFISLSTHWFLVGCYFAFAYLCFPVFLPVIDFDRDGNTDHLTCLLRNLYAGQAITVRTKQGTTKPGMLQPIGSQRVGHDLVTEQQNSDTIVVRKMLYIISSILNLPRLVLWPIMSFILGNVPCTFEKHTLLFQD